MGSDPENSTRNPLPMFGLRAYWPADYGEILFMTVDDGGRKPRTVRIPAGWFQPGQTLRITTTNTAEPG